MGGGRPPKVKICGLTSVDDAMRAVELGADYLGLNFYPPSPRCVDAATAGRIAAAVDGRCALVGVVARQPRSEIERAVEVAGLDYVQFHGDESAEEVAPFAHIAIKVFRVDDTVGEVDMSPFEACWAYMLDRKHGVLLGGTGESWTWSLARRLELRKPLFVAGGISPESARRAAAESGAFALDICSGVERSPGKKDWQLMERLFEELAYGD